MHKIAYNIAFRYIKASAVTLDETIIVDSSYNSVKYQKKLKKDELNQEQNSFHMSQSFMNEKSMYVSNKSVDSVFKRTLNVGYFDKKTL